MNRKLLNAVLGRRSKLDALRCLFSEPQEMTGREIGRRAGLSHLAAHKALSELVAEGVVERRSAPPTYQFRLNRKHWIVAEILAPMFEKETAWLESLEKTITQGLPKAAASAILFGSVVKGKLAPRSDIDILVLAREEKDKERLQAHFQGVGERFYVSFHHPLSTLVLSVEEFLKRYRAGEKFAKDISYSGRVISGKLLTEVLFEHAAEKDGR